MENNLDFTDEEIIRMSALINVIVGLSTLKPDNISISIKDKLNTLVENIENSKNTKKCPAPVK